MSVLIKIILAALLLGALVLAFTLFLNAVRVPNYQCADGFVKMHQVCVAGYDPAKER